MEKREDLELRFEFFNIQRLGGKKELVEIEQEFQRNRKGWCLGVM